MPRHATIRPHPFPGVRLIELSPREDERGCFTEYYRAHWSDAPAQVQFNLVHSHPHVLRGIHVHVRHTDYLSMVSGSLHIWLGDLRQDSPRHGCWEALHLRAEERLALLIPPGVAHGFHSPGDSLQLHGMSEYWCPEEEMGCHWADPALGLEWNLAAEPILSPRDRGLGGVDQLLAQLAPYQAGFAAALG